ncbi:MAG TPA: lysylphosphatidylglycerol synthase transmembrane domain-containing protein [Vicinamibacterales bacterium]|nr:lysylphosphatidylglycerol synthase transmembrane domain-containing protein [Vicinamibacterales bacterium]HOG28970.1 lysylphosphatidylglycerol synthase transmembrane domain-containing protein [Vicinamibacterales bacterium]HOQ60565.1 lysylphosphatidylglycerol synthase transmembrane domain-containing protein [Vicinamibacterales bacterium]HPK71991.1 lysylphosphatidylglycerol synthase transmembrane domain-containing protein [Vicinamibacterales bacterium]HPW21447.1 lysylphosphatidylglycerol syntha
MADRNDVGGPGPLRRALMLLLKLAVSAGLLGLLLARTDLSRLWLSARQASPLWLALALVLYLAMILLSGWRWKLLLDAQHVRVAFGRLVNSYLVAVFFNNFLPSNIGGDVIRIKDTAPQAGSKTLATTIVLMDRGLGLLGLLAVAAFGASVTGRMGGRPPILASMLWLALAGGVAVAAVAVLLPGGVGRLLSPLRLIHREWIDERIKRLTGALARFRGAPGALATCLAGAVLVQAVLVAFYAAVVRSMDIPLSPWHLAVIVPVSFVVQMAPVSLNGFGVREATFAYYFSRLGLSIESSLAVSFMGAGLVILFSLSGAAAYWCRGSRWVLEGASAGVPPAAGSR